MALTTCADCQKPLSTDAETCPHCGASTPASERRTNIRITVGVVLLVLAIVIWQTVWKSGVLRDLLPGLFE